MEEINCTTLSFNYSGNIAHQDHEINKAIRSLNKEQREVFDVVHKWSRDYIKQRSSKHPKEVKLFYIFLTGSAGVGKSHFTKTITMSLNKGLMRNSVNPDRPRVLILAPTGVAAININGRTVHSGLGLGIGKDFFPLNDKQQGILRNKLSEVKLVIINEISMVSSILFWQLNQRLQEIFGCKNKPFAGLPVIVCGDLCQPPAVNGAPIFNSKSSVKGLVTQDLWRMFCMAELTEVMRQREDFQFIQIINKIREGNCDEEVETILKSRFFSQPSDQFPKNALHVFAENAPVNEHNQIMLDKTESQFVIVPAIDILPKDCNINIESLQKRKLSETENLASLLKLKVGAQIMLTKNIDIDDKLVNGALGKVMDFQYCNEKADVVYIEFNDGSAGRNLMESNDISRRNNWVPIKRNEASFGVKENTYQPCVRRTQFPLALAWTCTVQKVQGTSLSEGFISFDLHRQRLFSQG